MTEHYKPRQYECMVLNAIEYLNDPQGSRPSDIIGYISDQWNLNSADETVKGNIYRALKQGINDDLITKTSSFLYTLSTRVKRKRNRVRKRRIWGRRHRRKSKRKKRKKRKKARRSKKYQSKRSQSGMTQVKRKRRRKVRMFANGRIRNRRTAIGISRRNKPAIIGNVRR